MKLAFLLYKYFPYGGMQRDFRRFVEEIRRRGHHCRVYCISWQGEPLAGADLRRVPAPAISNHRRDERFLRWVQNDLADDPVDGVVGFNKMPGLDVYYAADRPSLPGITIPGRNACTCCRRACRPIDGLGRTHRSVAKPFAKALASSPRS
jgi:hypothetical protein